MSENQTLPISRAEIDNFLEILDGFLVRSKLTLYDHYNAKYILAEDTIVLVCEMVAVSHSAIRVIEQSVDLLSDTLEFEIPAADLMSVTQLFLRTVDLSAILHKRNIFYEAQ